MVLSVRVPLSHYHEMQGSQGFKGFSRAFSKGHSKNTRCIIYLEKWKITNLKTKNCEKNKKNYDIFFFYYDFFFPGQEGKLKG